MSKSIVIKSGKSAEEILNAGRRRLLQQLSRESTQPVEITVETESKAIICVRLKYKPDSVDPHDREKQAISFLERYQYLIDPRVRSEEYRSVNDESSSNDYLQIFQRVINDVPVYGSIVMVRFAPDGTITGIENSVVSVSSEVEKTSMGREDIDTLAKFLPGLDRITRGRMLSENRFVDILIPAKIGRKRYLKYSNLVNWADKEDGGFRQNIIIFTPGEKEIMQPFFTEGPPSTRMDHAGSPEPLHHIDEKTNIPDFITYRPVGGVKVKLLTGENNPGETVHRFLEDHPRLFRTGAARNQYRVKKISESPILPGVHFVRMEQMYAGLPVFGAELVFELHDLDTMMSVMGHTVSAPYVDVKPKWSASQAITSAKRTVKKLIQERFEGTHADDMITSLDTMEQSAELGVFPGELVPQREIETRLVYKVNLGDFMYQGLHGGFFIFIDAHSGEALYSYSTNAHQNFVINDAEGRSQYLRPFFAKVNENGVHTSGNGLVNDEQVTRDHLVHIGNFFFDHFGWDGVDGEGRIPFVANINVGLTSPPNNLGCPNAFFDPMLTNEAFFCDGVAVGDVIAHEFTHGIIAHSSGLVYQDESGALHESYADIFGNLIFPDTRTGSWEIGEQAVGAGITARDMAEPDIGHSSDYLDRGNDPACTLMPWDCDWGHVHANSGITSLAHVLLCDGIEEDDGGGPIRVIPGIGRAKLATIAFLTLTQRLAPWSRLLDSALATYEMCQTLLQRNAFDIDGNRFIQDDVDQIPIAFNRVGLSPDLISGWAEPEIDFRGFESWFEGETTDSGCRVENVQASMTTPSGLYKADFSVEPKSVNYMGMYGISINTADVGTTSKHVTAGWFNIWGRKPDYYISHIEEAPPPGQADCKTSIGYIPVLRYSEPIRHPDEGVGKVFGDKQDESAGPKRSTMPESCRITKVEVQLLDDDDHPITQPGSEVKHQVCLFRAISTRKCLWTAERGAKIDDTNPPRRNRSPDFPNTSDLSKNVHWWYEAGTYVRYRLVYHIERQIGGPNCDP